MMDDESHIPFNLPFIIGNELTYIRQAVANGHLSGDGVFTRRCHDWLEENLGCHRAFLVHSCTAALEMAVLLCDISPGDEVIMPSYTFVSLANAVVLRGGVPVFVDIRRDSLNIDETRIEDAITPRTKAIMPVHYAGVPCAMDEIMSISEERGLRVIEDAAQAHLSTYRGRHLGTIGHFGCMSFHETKNVMSGEGGVLLVNDEKAAERAEIVWHKGTNRGRFLRGEVDRYSWVEIGSSYSPSELVAAFLFAQFEHSVSIMEKRLDILGRYRDRLLPLAGRGCLELPRSEDFYRSNGHMFYVLAGDMDERSRLIRHLRHRNIDSVFHYVPLHSSDRGVRCSRTHGSMEVTDDISRRLLRLPVYYELRLEDVDRISDAVISFFNQQ